jgi:hypothetical protein
MAKESNVTTFRFARVANVGLALVSVALLAASHLSGVANAEPAAATVNPIGATSLSPIHYAPDGTPEYGVWGTDVDWQVAGIVNIGEPSIRVVYDTSVPGSYQQALATVRAWQSNYSDLQQPGVTTGLREVGYTAHYNGVQVQVFSNLPSVSAAASTAFAQAGTPLIPMA